LHTLRRIRYRAQGNPSVAYQLKIALHLLDMNAAYGGEGSVFFSAIGAKQMTSPLVRELAAAILPSRKEDDSKPAGVTVGITCG
jgi:hypothetical protein